MARGERTPAVEPAGIIRKWHSRRDSAFEVSTILIEQCRWGANSSHEFSFRLETNRNQRGDEMPLAARLSNGRTPGSRGGLMQECRVSSATRIPVRAPNLTVPFATAGLKSRLAESHPASIINPWNSVVFTARQSIRPGQRHLSIGQQLTALISLAVIHRSPE
jgi:hypothetical protein